MGLSAVYCVFLVSANHTIVKWNALHTTFAMSAREYSLFYSFSDKFYPLKIKFGYKFSDGFEASLKYGFYLTVIITPFRNFSSFRNCRQNVTFRNIFTEFCTPNWQFSYCFILYRTNKENETVFYTHRHKMREQQIARLLRFHNNKNFSLYPLYLAKVLLSS